MRDGRTRSWNPRAAVVALAAIAAVLGAATPTANAAATGPCGTRTGPAPATYRHVIVIMEENKSITDVLGGSARPPPGRRRT